MLFLKHDRNMTTTTEVSLKILETDPTCRANEEAWRSALLTITGRLSRGKILFLLSLGRFSAMAISPGRGPFVRDFGNRGGKDFRKECLAIISPVTPAKLYCCIVIIFVLIALNVVLFSICVAVRSRKPDSHILYVPCPKGWIGFGRKCFYFSEDSKNWTFSQTFCTSREAVLAQFDTEEELNFLIRYKGPFDHWIGLSRESSHHAWKWTDNSTYNTSFGMTGDGECGYLNDLGVSSARSYTERKRICSKQIISPCP